MKQYQITYLAKENLKDKPIKEAAPELKVISVKDEGERQLVYKIKKQDRGHFVTVVFEVSPEKVVDLEKKLALNDEIWRFLLTIYKEISTPKPSALKEESILEQNEPVITEDKPAPAPDKKEKIKKKEEKVEKTASKVPAKPKTKSVKATPVISEEDRLKELDKKLDELLKE